MRRLLSAAILGLMLGSVAQPEKKPAPPAHVGIETRVFHPSAQRNWRGAEEKDLRCTIWYPSENTAVELPQTIGPPGAPLFQAGAAAPNAPLARSLNPFPLILLSHGSGGSAEQMAWLGTALAKAGYIAVAVNHPGNNAHEPYTKEGFALWWERATDLSEVLDGVLADKDLGPYIDTSRIAAAGYSLGGYTVLELAGAQTDIDAFFDLCAERLPVNDSKEKRHGPSQPDRDTTVCHVPEMRGMGSVDEILKAVRKTSAESLARSNESFRDPRIKAVFAIAPALGFTLTQQSLHEIHLPVEIVAGSADRIATPRDNADYLHAFVRGSRETVLPGAAHYTFLDSCTAEGKEKLGVFCTGEVNRDVVHAQVAAMAITFFNRALRM